MIKAEQLKQIEGSMPGLTEISAGCTFHPRCPKVAGECRQKRPKLTTLKNGVQVACHAVIQGANWRPELT